MFQLIAKKIIAILRKLFLLNWPYAFLSGGFGSDKTQAWYNTGYLKWILEKG